MYILSFDTSAATASAAVSEDNTVIAEYFSKTGLTHSETMLPLIDKTLKTAGIGIGDIGLIGVTAGPGSFTGVRIGVSLAKGFAQPGNIPIAAVSSLDAIAAGAFITGGGNSVPYTNPIYFAVMIDARNHNAFSAAYKYTGNTAEKILPDAIRGMDELLSPLPFPVFVIGDSIEKNYDYLNGLRQDMIFMPEDFGHPKAGMICRLAYEKYLKGDLCDYDSLRPIYLKESQAESEYAGKHK